jgi:hypothetical protein
MPDEAFIHNKLYIKFKLLLIPILVGALFEQYAFG